MKTKVESFDDIVFENRNQEYGAYELRKKYSKRGTVALAISLFLLFFAVGGPLIANIMAKDDDGGYIPVDDRGRVMENLDNKEPIVVPPPPPPPIADVKEIKFVAPTIVDTILNEKNDFATAGEFFDTKNSEPTDTTTHVYVEFKENKDPVIIETFEPFAVQEKPMFIGGDAALIKYVVEHTKYPVPALEGGIEGTVFIRFLVTKTGEIGEAKVLRAVDPLLEEEALRVVKSLPKWTPGKNNGNPVNVWFIIPVKFKLQ